MSSFATIIDTIRGRKKQAAIEYATSYESLVRAVATGDEIDADNAADILEIHGKSEEDFAKDCETQARRYGLVEKCNRLREVKATIPQLQAELDRAQRALQAAHDKLSPAVAEAARRLRETEASIPELSRIEGELVQTSLDTSIKIREAELNAQRAEIGRKMLPLQDDLTSARGLEQNLAAHVRTAKHSFNRLSQRDLPNRAEFKTKVKEQERRYQSAQNRVAELENLIAGVKAQLEPIDRELSELNAKKLEA